MCASEMMNIQYVGMENCVRYSGSEVSGKWVCGGSEVG